ncbi:tetraspanin-11-like [Mya arenaria]|uniref:tetraspanin-11-like n=1 Tax=Mya arenaria TaxID=6604 RepID=UPI0022E2E2E5|nr:tetraspanin-11-like [Mya arenaria]
MGAISQYGTTFIVLINTLFGVIGLTFLVGGSLVKMKPDLIDTVTKPLLNMAKEKMHLPEQLDVDTDSFKVSEFIGGAANAFIAVGGSLLALVIWAYMGTCLKSKWMLIVYAGLLSAIILGEVTFGIIVTKNRSLLDDGIKKSLKQTIANFYEGSQSNSGISLGWNALMAMLHCCGVDGAEDFRNTSSWDHTMNITGQSTIYVEAPVLCCEDTSTTPPCSAYSTPVVNRKYNGGCYEAIWAFIKDHQTLAIGVSAGLGAFELILLVITICVIRELPSGKKSKVGPM